jgi:hypothetical protein
MSNKISLALAVILVTIFCGCSRATSQNALPGAVADPERPHTSVQKKKNSSRVIHVMVALCDNENQGIVPVPAHLGNGDGPAKNLYWGAAYGVKTFFSKSLSWKKIAEVKNPKDNVLERVVFRHKTGGVFLVADAYRGSKMRETIDDFFSALTGEKREDVTAGDASFQTLGSADLVAFVGHDGLMDFEYEKELIKKDEAVRDAIVLACASRQYFGKHIKKTNAKPLLWTSNLMAPEAYILHDALEGWVKGETDTQIHLRGAAAYAKYQRINLKAAQRLIVTGW